MQTTDQAGAHLIEIDPAYGAIILERAAQEIGIVGKQESRSNGRS